MHSGPTKAIETEGKILPDRVPQLGRLSLPVSKAEPLHPGIPRDACIGCRAPLRVYRLHGAAGENVMDGEEEVAPTLLPEIQREEQDVEAPWHAGAMQQAMQQSHAEGHVPLYAQ